MIIHKVKVSIVMPSFLGEYDGAAINREGKFYRAVRSVQEQRFKQWELNIVSDGCEKTIEIYDQYFSDDERIKLIKIDKKPKWSPDVRNAGIDNSTGEWVGYLDTDDMFGVNHLHILMSQVDKGTDPIGWAYFNHYIAKEPESENSLSFDEEIVMIDTKGRCGTCNIIHRNQPEFRWNDGTYLHDWQFIKLLKIHTYYARFKTPEYYVCHYPGKIDV